LLGAPDATKESWVKITDEEVWVYAPNFVEHQSEKIFVWDSRIRFVKFYKYSGPRQGGLIGDAMYSGQENLRKLEFKVTWKSNVSKDARFRSLKILDVELTEKKFERASEDDKKQYNITNITE